MATLINVSRFLAWTVLIVGLLIGALRATVLRWVRLPADEPVLATSTLPTLRGGDLLLVTRVIKPTFGDLVLCPEPNAPERWVIGRIVGEAGDEIHLKDVSFTVNGKGFIAERGCDPADFTFPHPDHPNEEVTMGCDWEALANHLHMTSVPRGQKIRPTEQSFEVPEGHWFLLSDNRLFPYDSRDYGFVDKSTCKETVSGRLVSGKGWFDSENRMTFIQ